MQIKYDDKFVPVPVTRSDTDVQVCIETEDTNEQVLDKLESTEALILYHNDGTYAERIDGEVTVDADGSYAIIMVGVQHG